MFALYIKNEIIKKNNNNNPWRYSSDEPWPAEQPPLASFPTAPDGTGLTCGQHIESHSCIFSFLKRTVTSLFK
jgi:hypothetical protein